MLTAFGDFRREVYPVSCTDTGESLMAGKLSVRTVRTLARKAGYKNASRLGRALDIADNTARRWWNDDPTLQSFDRDILLKLCELLKCEPGDLITLDVTEEEQS
jgi:DNA-binding Xre family transcriptional regulator